MHVIAKAGLCALSLAALVPAGKALIGASGCPVANRDASIQELRRVPVPHIPQLKLPDKKTETQVVVHISGYGVVMSVKVVKSSGNQFVDTQAMISARMSRYAGKIVNCQPVPSDLTVSVPYDPNAPQPTPFPMQSLPPTPVPTGEMAQPIPIVQGPAVALPTRAAAPVARRSLSLNLLPQNYGNFGNASAGGILYFNIIDSLATFTFHSHPVVAFDLATGAELWRRESGIVSGANRDGVIVRIEPTESQMRDYTRNINAYLRAHTAPTSVLTELDRKGGRPLFDLPGVAMSGTIGGVSFTQGAPRVFQASSGSSGKLLWTSNGGPGGSITEPPVIRNGVLLQRTAESGAILEDVLYALDLRTGNAKWSTLSNERPLGFKGNTVYIDSTWFPERLDYYVPMSIAAVDLHSGKQLDEYTYRPDPIQNATQDYRQSPLSAYVAGGYAYVTVNNRWYRYDADREPERAHPVRLGNLSVEAAFENGRLLVEDATRAYVAESFPGSLLLHKFADGNLRSKIFEREDGTRYAVFGDTLYAFDGNGGVRRVGAVNCVSVYSIITWSGHAAVLCGAAGENASELLYTDTPERVATLSIPAQSQPPYRLQIHEIQIPGSSPDGRFGQWSVGPMAPVANGGLAITLESGARNSVMYVTANGKLRRVPIAPEIPQPTPNPNPTPFPTGPRGPAVYSNWPPRQPSPTELVAGKRGTLWFNDLWRPQITSLSANGQLTTKTVGSGSGASRSSAVIRLAALPNGDVWYARSLPAPQIGRADASLKFDVPAQYGNPSSFLAATDGALWFFSAASVVRMTPGGSFAAIAVPAQLLDARIGPPIVTAGSNGTIWAAQREKIYHLASTGVVREYTLPDATLWVGAMAPGCDGALYVAPQYAGVLFRLRQNGVFERYQVPFDITNIMRAPDCKLWFVQGSNNPTTSVGTFNLTRR